MTITNVINEDINKIIDAKRILYDQILTKLENETQNLQTTVEKQLGGAEQRISENIKILGHITIPRARDDDKMEFRMGRLLLQKVMSLEDVINYSNLATK